ncbi:MAG: Ig-like domain-containing protein, partial [Planctomycetota bacterium]
EDPGSWTQTTAVDYTPATALPVGPHTLYVQETDDAGNWSTSGSFEITIDAPPPLSDDGDDSGCLPASGAPGGVAVAILALAAGLWARRAGAGRASGRVEHRP